MHLIGLRDLFGEQEGWERKSSTTSSLPALGAIPLLVEARGGGAAPLKPSPSEPRLLPRCLPGISCLLDWAGCGPPSAEPIATRRTSPCHVCCKLRHAFPVSAQHLSSLGRHEIAEGPIQCVSDPLSPGDPPSRTTHGTLNFNPAVPFV